MAGKTSEEISRRAQGDEVSPSSGNIPTGGFSDSFGGHPRYDESEAIQVTVDPNHRDVPIDESQVFSSWGAAQNYAQNAPSSTEPLQDDTAQSNVFNDPMGDLRSFFGLPQDFRFDDQPQASSPGASAQPSNTVQPSDASRTIYDRGKISQYMNELSDQRISEALLYDNDEEAFPRTPEPLMDKYPDLDHPERTGAGIEWRDNRKQDALIDQNIEDIQVGLFPVRGQHLVETGTKKTGINRELRWDKNVEGGLVELMDLFGMTDYKSTDNQRTIFRLVRLYASMTYDRNGNMWRNQNEGSWYMESSEFKYICDCIKESVSKFGHPMVLPRLLKTTAPETLRDTYMYPSGVMPAVVARAICGPGSAIQVSPAELVQLCQNEWVTRTYPTMKNDVETGRAKADQMVVVEDFQRALARLDGISDTRFSQRYGISTEVHYRLSEYMDVDKAYAQVMNGNYDADACLEYQQQIEDEFRKQADKLRGIRYINTGRFDNDGKPIKEAVETRSISALAAGLNLTTSVMKTNALAFNVPIAVSAIAEKGVGDLQTWLSLKIAGRAYGGVKDFKLSKSAAEKMRTREAIEAIDAAEILLEIGGPGALLLFCQDSANSLNHDSVIKWLSQNYLPKAGSKGAEWIQAAQRKLDKITKVILAGDVAFKKFDATNWLNGLIVNNAALAHAQKTLGEAGQVDTTGGIAFTGRELEEILASDFTVEQFIKDMLTTRAGRDAMIQMRSNNIANFNPVSFKVGQILRQHGVTNAMITSFVDTFAKYGINFLYTMVPFSRTMTYITVRRMKAGGSLTADQYVMGGGLPIEGLRMNLIFDGVTLGKWIIVGGIFGLALAALGMEPPEDPKDWKNISMWKIGTNVGWGEDGHGVEIQFAYWINDLTQFALPFAYFVGVLEATGDAKLATACMMDSLADQVDGNVVLDFVDTVKNFNEDLLEFKAMSEDPSYSGPVDQYSHSLLALKGACLGAFAKVSIGAPLIRSMSNSALIMGEDYRARNPYATWDRSSEWAIDVGKTDYVPDYEERMMRKYSMNNIWLGLALDLTRNLGDPTATGYMFFEMPPKTKSDQTALVYAKMFEMDYDNMGEGVDKVHYDADKAELLRQEIEKYEDWHQAVRQGFFIPQPLRDVAIDLAYAEINALENEFQMKSDAGEYETNDEWWDAYRLKEQRQDDLYKYLDDWLKNPEIPEWHEAYEQLLSDWDVSYFDSRTGEPMNGFAALFSPYAESRFILKGNHPTSLAPFTVVDTRDTSEVKRGWNGETLAGWFSDGTTGSDLRMFQNGIGQEIVPSGYDKGKTLNEALFGMDENGNLLHPDQPTVGRGYVNRG